MAQFADCLKLAKYIARYQGKNTIDISALRSAMAFFKPDDELRKLVGDIPSAAEKSVDGQKDDWFDLGQSILAAYESFPTLTLDDDVKAIREKIDVAKHIAERYPADLAPSPDNIKAVRALVTSDFQKSLESYKPNDLKQAEAFGQRLKSVLDQRLHLHRESKPATIRRVTLPPEQPPPDVAPPPTQASAPGFQLDPAVARLREALERELLDQPLATIELIEELQARAWGLVPDRLPQLFLLAGPPASGKNLLAQILARELDDRPRITLNLASMSSRNEGFALTGLRSGYDSAGPGRLTGFVHANPKAIVVLENFDQAHPNVQNLLVPLFTEGTLIDEYGFGPEAHNGQPGPQGVSFKNAIVLLTTSQGAAVYERRDYPSLYEKDPAQAISLLGEELVRGRWAVAGDRNPTRETDSVLTSALPPYLGLCRVLPFRALGLQALYALARRSVDTFRASLKATKTELLVADEDALDMALTLSMGPDFNPVELQTAAGRVLLPALMRHGSRPTGSIGQEARTIRLEVKDNAEGDLAQLRKQTPALVKSDFFRRSQRLRYTLDTKRGEDGTLTLTMQIMGIERVPISTDYGTDGGITIDLPQRRFKDVFGHHYIKDRLQEVVRLLRRPPGSESNAISLPKGMLLHGRPGTGKTMLAKALAAEASLPFIAVNGPWLLDVEHIRALFRLARKYAPSLVFIDEIDALGVRGRDGFDVSINQLLTEIDGFDESRDGSVFVIAATNFPRKVDPALTRSGRLDLCLEVPMLDAEARRHFLEKLTTLPHVQALDLDALVELSAGMSGADLEKLRREATLDTIRRPREVVTQAELLELLNVIKHGARVEKPPLKEQLASTAYHEAGHAVVSLILNPDVRIEQVTIVPRGEALGFTAYNEESLASRHFNRHEVMDMICVAMAGRIAESRQFPEDGALGGPDAGAAADLAQATRYAWRAITEWGLDEEFGWVSMRQWDDDTPPDTWQLKAAQRVEAWLSEAREITRQTVDQHWPLIEALAKKLLKEEFVDGKALKQLVAQYVNEGGHAA